MDTSACVSMSARTNLEIERTIDLVFFRTKNALQAFCHMSRLQIFDETFNLM